MKTKNKKVYVSNDGRIFDTRKACRDWEDGKLYCDPIHLTNEQIIGLIKTAFYAPFIMVPRDLRTEVSLYIRRDVQDDTNFDFYFDYIGDENKPDTFNGSVRYSKGDLWLQLGYNENDNFWISPNWTHWSDFHVRELYSYLSTIGYFKKKKEEPELNPLFRKKGWHKIYTEDYSITPVEIIKDPVQVGKNDTGPSPGSKLHQISA